MDLLLFLVRPKKGTLPYETCLKRDSNVPVVKNCKESLQVPYHPLCDLLREVGGPGTILCATCLKRDLNVPVVMIFIRTISVMQVLCIPYVIFKETQMYLVSKQFLAAMSLWMKWLLSRYSHPLATSIAHSSRSLITRGEARS